MGGSARLVKSLFPRLHLDAKCFPKQSAFDERCAPVRVKNYRCIGNSALFSTFEKPRLNLSIYSRYIAVI